VGPHGWGDEIDIVATSFRKLNHHGGYLRRFYLHSLSKVADIIVLAKTAKQIAGTDKDCP